MKSIWKFRNPFEIQIKYVMVKILVSVKFRHTSGRSQERPLGYQQCSAVQLAMPDCKINWVGWYQNIYKYLYIWSSSFSNTGKVPEHADQNVEYNCTCSCFVFDGRIQASQNFTTSSSPCLLGIPWQLRAALPRHVRTVSNMWSSCKSWGRLCSNRWARSIRSPSGNYIDMGALGW